jgi:hypothetical protein
MNEVIERLGPITVLNLDGVPVPLREFWAKNAAVIVWLRHFG